MSRLLQSSDRGMGFPNQVPLPLIAVVLLTLFVVAQVFMALPATKEEFHQEVCESEFGEDAKAINNSDGDVDCLTKNGIVEGVPVNMTSEQVFDE